MTLADDLTIMVIVATVLGPVMAAIMANRVTRTVLKEQLVASRQERLESEDAARRTAPPDEVDRASMGPEPFSQCRGCISLRYPGPPSSLSCADELPGQRSHPRLCLYAQGSGKQDEH